MWALGDIRARGFLMGGTAGRTTLMGEGLQHADGHSHLLASTIPAIRSYDPAWAYELAVIVRHGLQEMFVEQKDEIFYITIHNEAYEMPPMPEGVQEGIIRGLYRFRPAAEPRTHRAQILASGPIMREALRAQQILAEKYDVAADVWSATSYLALRREALEIERWNRHHPDQPARVSYVASLLDATEGPVICVSDWMKAVPDQIARWVRPPFVSLGTDGFGMSDTREVMRRHFEIDAGSIIIATLHQLFNQGAVSAQVVRQAMEELEYDPEKLDPMSL